MKTDLLPPILTVEMLDEQEPILRKVIFASSDTEKRAVFAQERATLVEKYGEFGAQWADLLEESLFDKP